MKRYLWLIPTILVLVGAFLLPDLLLNAKEKRVESSTYTADASQTWQGSGTGLSMGEKLSLLGNINEPVEYSFGILADDGEIRDKYDAELGILYEKQLISNATYERLHQSDFEIEKYVILDMEQGESLSMYRVQYYDATTYAILDAQSCKIFGLVISTYSTFVIDNEYELLYSEYQDEYGVSAPDWAEYYGAKESERYGMDRLGQTSSEDYYLYALSFTLDGIKLGFTAHYSEIMETITWRPDSVGNVEWLISGVFPDNAEVEGSR